MRLRIDLYFRNQEAATIVIKTYNPPKFVLSSVFLTSSDQRTSGVSLDAKKAKEDFSMYTHTEATFSPRVGMCSIAAVK